MSDPAPDQNLHLPSLVIKNFRGIDELTIPRLGRVTLLAGKNGVGKSTVLDAVKIYAERGQMSALEAVLHERGDIFVGTGREEDRMYLKESGDTGATKPDWYSLFTDRRNSPSIEISIGSMDNEELLRIGWAPEVRLSADQPVTFNIDDFTLGPPNLVVKFGNSEHHLADPASFPPIRFTIPNNTLGPNVPTDETAIGFWNDVALTPVGDRAIEALNIVTGVDTEQVAALDPPAARGQTHKRRLMARVKGLDYPVPVRSLGDGAMRCFVVALALAKSGNGFLFIDEVENGLHYSIQYQFWKMALQAAQRNNVQVLATTHSGECAYSFGQAAKELEHVEGVYYRIQRNGPRLRAVPYPEDELVIAAEHGIEVR